MAPVVGKSWTARRSATALCAAAPSLGVLILLRFVTGFSGAAGIGSAVLGTLQSILGGIASPLVGLGGENTAVPLFAGMAGCSLIAVLALLLTRGDTPPLGSPHDSIEASKSTTTGGNSAVPGC
ncbi:hypothetical protein [Streptomyces eurythermus]|uniref:hypothetical protein n=1 Tax=Streptomyces eurythermus TaxID=42237 RepID=UPI00340F4E5F